MPPSRPHAGMPLVRSFFMAVFVGAGFASLFAIGRPRAEVVASFTFGAVVSITIWAFIATLECLFRQWIEQLPERVRPVMHGLLFLVSGLCGWIFGVAIVQLLRTGEVSFHSQLRSGALISMLITVIVVVVVGLIMRAIEILRVRLSASLERLKEHEWAEKELEMARSIQSRLLPPQRIDGEGFCIAARNLPARFVAGDFYDVVRLEDGSIGIIVADVAGKGMAASLIVASVKAVLPFVGRAGVQNAMTMLNDKLVQELDRREFVALAYARFVPADGTLEVANAGLPDPYLMRDGCVQAISVPGPRLPLGVKSDMRYETTTTALRPGDRLLLLSDGIPEALLRDREDELFGYDRLVELLRSADGANLHPDDWLEHLLTRVRAEVQEPLDDDWTALVLQVPQSMT